MAPSPPPPFFYNWAKLFAILPWGGANFFYPCLYCLLCLVLGSLHVLLNATITSGLVELFGSVVKSAAESFLLIAYIAFASRNYRSALPGLHEALSSLDAGLGVRVAAGVSASASSGAGVERQTLVYLGYSLFTVFFSSAAAARVGMLTCEFDRRGLVPMLPTCWTRVASNVASAFLIEAPVALGNVILVHLVLSLRQRNRLFQERLKTALSTGTTTAADLESLRSLQCLLDATLSDVVSTHDPQLLVFAAFTFSVTMGNLFFGQMSCSICLCLDAGVPLVAWAAIQAGSLFLLANACHLMQEQADKTPEILKEAKTVSLDPAARGQIGHLLLGFRSVSVSCSGFFAMNREFFLNYVNTVATYLTIMMQFHIAILQKTTCDGDGYEGGDGSGGERVEN